MLKTIIKSYGIQILCIRFDNVYCDNQNAIELNRNNVFHGRSKHIDIRYHFSREVRDRGEINISYLPTDKMIADLLTKPLTKVKHENCVKSLRLN